MRTVEELEALLEAATRERDMSLAAWEAAGMTGRTAQSAMLELARQLEEAQERIELLTELRDEEREMNAHFHHEIQAKHTAAEQAKRERDEHREKRSMYAAECVSLRARLADAQRERDEARETIVALTTAKAEADLEIATLTAALDERDVEAERGLEQYDRLVHQLADATNETTRVRLEAKREADMLQDRLSESRSEVDRLTDERDELLVRVANQDAELRATREAYTRSHLILKAIHGALTDALPSTPIPALDSFDVVELVRNIVAECERMKTFAAQNFSQMIRQEAEQMREYGLSYEGVRKVLHEYNDGEISFGKLMDLIRAAARAMAEDMKK